MEVVREHVAELRFGHLFPNGRSDVVVGIVYRVECGCKIEFGIRLDNKETAMLADICDRHIEKWHVGVAVILADENRDTPTDEVLKMAIEAMEAS